MSFSYRIAKDEEYGRAKGVFVTLTADDEIPIRNEAMPYFEALSRAIDLFVSHGEPSWALITSAEISEDEAVRLLTVMPRLMQQENIEEFPSPIVACLCRPC